MAIPEIPAAFALGISVDTVAHPGTVRDAVAALTAHIGSDGEVKPGLAVEAAPFRPLFEKYDVDEWSSSTQWMRIADSLRLSLATSTDPNAPAGTTSPTLAAAGLRVAIIDQRDYRYNATFIKWVRTALAACGPGPGQMKPGEGGAAYSTGTLQKDCADKLGVVLKDLDKTLTSGHRLELDAALTFAQGQPATDVSWRSAHFWLAYDYGFGSGTVGGAGDVLLHDDDAGNQVTDYSVGARLSIGQPKVSWSASALLGSSARTSAQRDVLFRYGLALAVKMTSYGIIKAGIQGSHDFDSHADGAILFVNLSAATGDSIFQEAVAHGVVPTAPPNP